MASDTIESHNRLMSNTGPTPEPRLIPLNRSLVGGIAILCLVTAIGLRIGFSGDTNKELWVTGFGRAGLIMAALWIALPGKHRQAAWANVSPMTLLGLGLAIFAIAARPAIIVRMLPIFGALGAIAYYLRPRPKAKDERPDRGSWQDRT